jgi:hypothetical protein
MDQKMIELFKKVKIDGFDSVQKELLACIKHDYKSKGVHAFTYDDNYMQESCPIFYSWLLPRLKLPVRMFRFYVTPPGEKLKAHIDGNIAYATVPFGLNIPVVGTKNTYQIYHDCPSDNIQGGLKTGYMGGMHPIDIDKLKEIYKLEILQPCFTRNNIMHSVENNSEEFRVMFTVRWILDPIIGRKIEEVIDTTNLFDY